MNPFTETYRCDAPVWGPCRLNIQIQIQTGPEARTASILTQSVKGAGC